MTSATGGLPMTDPPGRRDGDRHGGDDNEVLLDRQ
jgi:hypothetical protein